MKAQKKDRLVLSSGAVAPFCSEGGDRTRGQEINSLLLYR